MRLFVAVRPPDSVLDQLAALPRARGSTARWTTRDQWHITLRFFGNVEDPSSIISALSPAVAWLAPFNVTLGPRAGVLGKQVVYLPVVGLEALAETVVRATAEFGDPPPTRRFRGHLTLARTKGGIVDLSALTLEASWKVGEIELIRSLLGGGPARYETIASFSLTG